MTSRGSPPDFAFGLAGSTVARVSHHGKFVLAPVRRLAAAEDMRVDQKLLYMDDHGRKPTRFPLHGIFPLDGESRYFH